MVCRHAGASVELHSIMPRQSLLGAHAYVLAGRGYTWVKIRCKSGGLKGQFWVQFNILAAALSPRHDISGRPACTWLLFGVVTSIAGYLPFRKRNHIFSEKDSRLAPFLSVGVMLIHLNKKFDYPLIATSHQSGNPSENSKGGAGYSSRQYPLL